MIKFGVGMLALWGIGYAICRMARISPITLLMLQVSYGFWLGLSQVFASWSPKYHGSCETIPQVK